MKNKRRLFFDIETSPNVILSWRVGYQIDISFDSIVKERAIICICYKWDGEKKVHSLTWDANQNDKEMLEKFSPILNSADEVIAHNSDRFDVTWVRTRALYHGISIDPSITTIDTLKIARGKFKFNSNKLDYLGEFLGLGRKKKTDYKLWKEVTLNNNKRALKEMVSYCKQDVLLLEKVFNKMNSYIVPKSNFATHIHHCPECNSKNTQVAKRRITAAGTKKIQFTCKDCGKYHSVAESKFNKRKDI